MSDLDKLIAKMDAANAARNAKMDALAGHLATIRQALESAAADLAQRDATITRLRALLAEAVEVLDAWVDPRYCSQEEADWHSDALARIKAEIATSHANVDNPTEGTDDEAAG